MSEAEVQLNRLTPRQRQVLEGIASSKSTVRIADSLGLSPKTVEWHRIELESRLRIFDVAGLTRFAIRTGVVQL